MYRTLYRFLTSLARLAVRTGRSKDLEIVVLRHQLGVLHRQNNRPDLNDDDRSMLAAIAQALPRRRRHGWLVTPDTLLRWHRRRIANHWTQLAQKPGRPSTHAEVRRLIIQMAADNPTWGYRRIHGELNSLGHNVGASLRSQAAIACDFASVDTAFLRRYYLLFFIDITTREVFFAGITATPTGSPMPKQPATSSHATPTGSPMPKR